MKKTVELHGVEVEADVLKTSPLAILPTYGGGYILVHVEKQRVVLLARTKALAARARRELSGLNWDDEDEFGDPLRAAQALYMTL